MGDRRNLSGRCGGRERGRRKAGQLKSHLLMDDIQEVRIVLAQSRGSTT